jgi:transmembrane sensor
MDNTRLHYLLKRYINKTITPDEQTALSDFLNARDNETQLELLIEEAWIQSGEENETYFTTSPAVMLDNITAATHRPLKPVYWQRWAAAVLLLIVAGGSWLFFNRDKKINKSTLASAGRLKKEVVPGSNKAVLTLADGATIELDSSLKGKLAQQGNINLHISPGLLKYDKNSPASTGAISYNILRTPKGGQYQLVLPDGSKVWLNAASSLKFPTVFNGKERKVELTGEAYFEVTKNASQPFQVAVNNANVAVLGTSFNIMAYTNEAAIKTTLLEGAVKVSQEQESRLLKPGEQSLLDATGKMQVIEKADLDLAVAWKNGFTSFKGADIKTIMRQVERWYDVEVVYSGTIPARSFTGDIPRDAQLSELLRLLEISKIHFRMDDNKLIVTP